MDKLVTLDGLNTFYQELIKKLSVNALSGADADRVVSQLTTYFDKINNLEKKLTDVDDWKLLNRYQHFNNSSYDQDKGTGILNNDLDNARESGWYYLGNLEYTHCPVSGRNQDVRLLENFNLIQQDAKADEYPDKYFQRLIVFDISGKNPPCEYIRYISCLRKEYNAQNQSKQQRVDLHEENEKNFQLRYASTIPKQTDDESYYNLNVSSLKNGYYILSKLEKYRVLPNNIPNNSRLILEVLDYVSENNDVHTMQRLNVLPDINSSESPYCYLRELYEGTDDSKHWTPQKKIGSDDTIFQLREKTELEYKIKDEAGNISLIEKNLNHTTFPAGYYILGVGPDYDFQHSPIPYTKRRLLEIFKSYGKIGGDDGPYGVTHIIQRMSTMGDNTSSPEIYMREFYYNNNKEIVQTEWHH